MVIARGNARAVRGNVTVTGDRLIAHYRKKANPPAPGANAQQGPQATPAATGGLTLGDTDTSGNEIYRVEADGNVHVFTPTDHAEGDHAVYDLDQAVMLMTGKHLRLTTPNDVITARDDLEYWSQKHMAVARGDAVVVTTDGRRFAGDTLVAYTTEGQQNGQTPGQSQTPGQQQTPAQQQATQPAQPPQQQANASGNPPNDTLAASGKLQKVEAYGNVSVRTATDTVTGDRGVYVPDTGIARIAGNVRITRGQNQLIGAEAEVNFHTGVSNLIAGDAGRVQGLVVPNDAQNSTGDANGQNASGQKPGGQNAGGQKTDASKKEAR
ncbi:MAG: LptA/OstA family protein [Alphaproteobacteria bacterium]|nr:LptA/OstA family protein [Alphaproteobacteria bacterium]